MKDIIRNVTDLKYLKWSKTRSSSGTAGTFLKSYEVKNGRKIYYKLSDYDPVKGIVGHECVNEIIAGRLMDLMGVEHLAYTLVHADIEIEGREYRTWLCRSEDFKSPGESKITLEEYYETQRLGKERPMEFCLRMGWAGYVSKMLVVDHIILNRDRHGANIEVLRDKRKKGIRLFPLFDQGLSLLCRVHEPDGLENYDVMEDKQVQSFVGGRSTRENLDLIPGSEWTGISLPERIDRDTFFEGLSGILDERYYDVIREMITGRIEYVRSIRDSRCINE
ncbi:MAG: hypothetical protein K5888_02355 [Lachnospiraceae bacterium]|nr:hypothetical protein [Lachnospiraceae bacterium]